jgi:uncharacterized membrane protein YphA (DoxX/SURF4 family)
MKMSVLRNAARYLIAPVFIFSGFVKAIDPLGSAYKFTDYFEVMGMPWLSSLSIVLAILLSSAELLIGLTLFFKIRMRIASWALLIFMCFFTILTFFIALKNPVTDCGCFGDALVLSNWQTFIKNLIFLVPTSVVFWQRNKYEDLFSCRTEWIAVSVLFISGILLSVYSYRNLPMIDFRPYKTGTNITKSMEVLKGMPVDQYKTTLVYAKNGEKKEFTLKNAPWNDSTWKWVETKNTLIKKGYVPPIHNFTISSADGEDITRQVLDDEGYTFLIISYNIDKASRKGLSALNQFAAKAIENGYNVIGLTASSTESVEQFRHDTMAPYRFYSTDETTLKTMLRSNPGLMLIKDGTIMGIWHYRNIPDDKIFEQGGLAYVLAGINARNVHNLILSLILLLILVSLTIFILAFRNNRE